MFVKKIVCSGVNEKNSFEEILRFLQTYPNVELGIQISPEKVYINSQRYNWIKGLSQELDNNNLRNRLALHINLGFVVDCCEANIPQEIDNILSLNQEKNIFNRVQLNFKIGRENFNNKKIPDINKLIKSIDYFSVKGVKTIISCNSANKLLINELYQEGVIFDILFDDSFGMGIRAESWDKPLFDNVLHGYAGGLGPQNIQQELNKIKIVSNTHKFIFVDAQGKLETENKFDFVKASSFVKNINSWNMNESRNLIRNDIHK